MDPRDFHGRPPRRYAPAERAGTHENRRRLAPHRSAALKILEQYGLIKRTPHVGTTVINRGALLSFNRQLSTLSDLDRLAERNPRKLLDIREAVLERPLSDELGRPAGDVCIRFSMIQTGSADGAPPIAWTTEPSPGRRNTCGATGSNSSAPPRTFPISS